MNNIYKPLAILGLAASTTIGCATTQQQPGQQNPAAYSSHSCEQAVNNIPAFKWFGDVYMGSALKQTSRAQAHADSTRAGPLDAQRHQENIELLLGQAKSNLSDAQRVMRTIGSIREECQ